MPAGTDLVVVAGPQVGFVEPELQTLTRFLIGGGRVLLLLDPILGAGGLERTGFGPWLEGYGVKLGEDIVVDPTNPLPFYSAETFFANEYGVHPITKALEDANYPVIFSLARSVDTLPQDADAGIKVTQLVRSSRGRVGRDRPHQARRRGQGRRRRRRAGGPGSGGRDRSGRRRDRRRRRRIAHRARRGRSGRAVRVRPGAAVEPSSRPSRPSPSR